MRHLLFVILSYLLTVGSLWAEPAAEYRKYSIKINIVSPSEYYATTHTEVVIYKETKSYLANFYTALSKNEKLDHFSCTMQGLNGNFTKKFKASHLQRSEYSSSLANDVEKVFLDIDIPTYPIVITTDVTTHQTDNAISYPPFSPLTEYDVAVKEASYEISFPNDLPLRYATVGSPLKPVISSVNGKTQWTFSVNDIQPIARERYSKSLSELTSKVFFLPERFNYFGTHGSMATWEDFGKWIGSLCDGQDGLPEAAKVKVHALTDTCTSDWSKVKVLYDYLRQTTRYVSIQLGIGGYKPLPAEYVWRTGFGDCKALSNYMKAMLAEVGVPSTYTLISTKYNHLLQLPNFQQLNHVILKVPTNRQVIWMECTNPEVPLGYTHDDIAGHDAIEILPQGGKFVTLPDYPDSLNLRTSRIKATLRTDGSADIDIDEKFLCHRYSSYHGWTKKSDSERRDLASAAYNISSGNITKAECKLTECGNTSFGIVPVTSIKVAATAVKVANTSGSRIFLPVNLVNIYHKYSDIAKDRKQDIFISQGSKSEDILEIKVPEGFEVEALPRAITESNEIGSFSSHAVKDGDKITITNIFVLRHGEYSAEKASLIDALYNAQFSAYRAKVVVKPR